MAYKEGDIVVITGNDILEHVFNIGQECTYIKAYSGDVHELSGLYGITDIQNICKQSVSGNCFKNKE